MGRILSVVIILAIIAGGGGYLWQVHTEQEDRKAVDGALADARRSFADLARAASKEKDDDEYRRQLRSAMESYESELSKRVYAKRPEWRDLQAYRTLVEERFDEGQMPEAQRKSMLEGFDIVKDAYTTLKQGRWKSVFNRVGAGDTRLDVYEMRRTTDDNGNSLLEGRFFFWGIEDSTRVRWGQLNLRYWHTVEKTTKTRRGKVTKMVEEVYGKAEGESTPRVIIQNPGAYIGEFPSYVAVGYIWLPAMPKAAEKFDLTLTYSLRKGGADHEASLRWSKLPVPNAWKLGEGESWNADIVEATKEEIAGKDGTEEEEEEGQE